MKLTLKLRRQFFALLLDLSTSTIADVFDWTFEVNVHGSFWDLSRVKIRDVTKFEFEFNNVRTSNVFNRFEIRRMF